MANQYYIVSMEHSRVAGGCVALLGPDRAGVTCQLTEAGRYSEAEVNSDLDYFDNGQSHLALLCSAVEQHAEPMVPLAAMASKALIKTDLEMRVKQ